MSLFNCSFNLFPAKSNYNLRTTNNLKLFLADLTQELNKMITRYYIREISTGNYYYLFHGAEGFLPQIEDAYIFNSRNDLLIFLDTEQDSELFEGRNVEIVEIFCF